MGQYSMGQYHMGLYNMRQYIVGQYNMGRYNMGQYILGNTTWGNATWGNTTWGNTPWGYTKWGMYYILNHTAVVLLKEYLHDLFEMSLGLKESKCLKIYHLTPDSRSPHTLTLVTLGNQLVSLCHSY